MQGSATNRRKALAMQRVRGDAVGVHVRVELCVCPVDERVEFDETGHAVHFEAGEGSAVVALGRTQPRDPHSRPVQRTLERVDFADAAAGFSGFKASENGRHALLVHKRLQRRGVGEVRGEVKVAVLAAGSVDQVIRLRKESARIERDEFDRQVVPRDEIC